MNRNTDVLLVCTGPGTTQENLNKLTGILEAISEDTLLIMYSDITDNKYKLRRHKGHFVKRFLCDQLQTSRAIFLACKNNEINIVLFAFGQDLQLIPIIYTKLKGKKIILRSDGRPSVVMQNRFKYKPLSFLSIAKYFFWIIEEINYRLADCVLTECEYMISKNHFQKYNSCVGNLFVDTVNFSADIPIQSRKYDVGFVGRLLKVKGIKNFLRSLELLHNNYNIVIIGDGEEKHNVIHESQLLPFTYINWIENRELPKYLNDIKLLVVPSYMEGLPNTILEAMACGTAVLATPVGGIPGVIKDGKTGFILKNNSPECIATNVIRALDHPDICRITSCARALVEHEFAFENAVKRWRIILEHEHLKR